MKFKNSLKDSLVHSKGSYCSITPSVDQYKWVKRLTSVLFNLFMSYLTEKKN